MSTASLFAGLAETRIEEAMVRGVFEGRRVNRSIDSLNLKVPSMRWQRRKIRAEEQMADGCASVRVSAPCRPRPHRDPAAP